VPRGQIIAGDDEVGFGCSNGGGEGLERRQTVIAKSSDAYAGLGNGMSLGADDLHEASSLRDSNSKSSCREPTRSGCKQNAKLQPAFNLS
jgi:hypothetical protein